MVQEIYEGSQERAILWNSADQIPLGILDGTIDRFQLPLRSLKRLIDQIQLPLVFLSSWIDVTKMPLRIFGRDSTKDVYLKT